MTFGRYEQLVDARLYLFHKKINHSAIPSLISIATTAEYDPTFIKWPVQVDIFIKDANQAMMFKLACG